MYHKFVNEIRIDWTPEDEELAAQAMNDMRGPDPQKGVPEHVDLPDEGSSIELPESAAQRVRDRYAELYEKKHGYPMGFTPLVGEDAEDE